jgi:hypothetical protein
MHSGVAHLFRWPVIHRTDVSNAVPDGQDDELGGLVTNDDDHLIVSATVMYLLIKRAFALYDLSHATCPLAGEQPRPIRLRGHGRQRVGRW